MRAGTSRCRGRRCGLRTRPRRRPSRRRSGSACPHYRVPKSRPPRRSTSGEPASTSERCRRRHFAHRDKSNRCHGVRQRLCRAFGDDVHRHVTQHRPEPGQCGFGDEDLDDELTPQRRLDEVRPLGEEALGTAPSDVAMQLDRCRHPVGALGERQAASPDGALTSSGSAPLATSTSAVNAVGSLTASSARILRSTSTPAALSPWISRL